MKYCKNCGTMLTDAAKFCTNCGTPAEEVHAENTSFPEHPADQAAEQAAGQSADFFSTSAEQQQQDQRREEAKQKASEFAESAKQKTAEFFEQMNQVSDETDSFTQQDIEGHTGMAVLSYFGILVLIPIFAGRDSRYVKFHANQGLLLMIASIVLNVLSTVLGLLHLGLIGSLVGFLHLPLFVFSIMGIVNAIKGRAKELPVVGHYRLL